MKVLMIGGGIGGSVAAVALQKAGIEAVVYEAYDKAADGVGAYLTLATNGLAALQTIGIKASALEGSFQTPRMTFSLGSGYQLAEIQNGPTLADGTVSLTIKRSDLYRSLRDEALGRGIQIEYGKRLIDVQNNEDGVIAHFADGSQAKGDVLIGCDGLQSRARQLIDPSAPKARYVGLLNTGGYSRGVSVPGTPGTMYMSFGRRCFFCYIPHPNGEVWWFANPSWPKEPTREELSTMTPENWKSYLLELFAKDKTPASEIIRASYEILPGWATYDFPSVPRWSKGRMLIIGDAAHATSPSSGQGASMAIEDAVTIAKCLRDAPSIPEAFSLYESLRRERVEKIVAQGKKNGDSKAPGPLGRIFRDLILKLVFKRISSTRDQYKWVYEHRIDWATPGHTL